MGHNLHSRAEISLLGKIFIEPVTIFAGDLEQNLHPQSFAVPSMEGYQASCLQRCRMQFAEREHAKQVLKKRFYFNCLTRYSGNDTQGSQDLFQTFF